MTSDCISTKVLFGSRWQLVVRVYVAGVRTRVSNVFVSSAKRVRLQCQKCSSPDQHKTRSLLAINAFACMQCDIVFGSE